MSSNVNSDITKSDSLNSSSSPDSNVRSSPKKKPMEPPSQRPPYLDENGMGYTGSIIFAGAWIETMYLGVKVNENETNENLINRLSEQAVILESLIASIKQNDEDNEFGELVTDLEKINTHFEGFNSDSDEEFVLSTESVKALSSDVTDLRTKIVGE